MKANIKNDIRIRQAFIEQNNSNIIKIIFETDLENTF